MNEKLITDHLGYMERITTSVCRNVPRYIDAEDLFGAGYLALCQAAERFDPTAGATFATFAYHPVRSAVTVEAWWLVNWRAWTNIGKARPPRLVDWDDSRDVAEDPRAQRSAFWHDLARDYVREQLSTLREPDRSVLELRFLEGVLQKDVGERLGKSSTSVHLYMRRGLESLRVLLEDEEDELAALLETKPRRVVRDMAKHHASKAYSRPDSKTAFIRLNKARLKKRSKRA